MQELVLTLVVFIRGTTTFLGRGDPIPLISEQLALILGHLALEGQPEIDMVTEHLFNVHRVAQSIYHPCFHLPCFFVGSERQKRLTESMLDFHHATSKHFSVELS